MILCMLKMYALTCILYSCHVGDINNSSVQKINIPVETNSEILDLSNIADNIEFIPLETNDSTILDNITRIINESGYLYVSDKHSLYKFNSDGKLCGKISKEGVGPKEYIQISDFQVAKDTTIWILSRNNKCVYNYGWNGELKCKIELNFWASKICLVDDKTMLMYIGNEKDNDNSHQLKLFNLEDRSVIANYLPIDDKKSNYMHIKSNNCFYRDKDSVYFFKVFCDTVYSIAEKVFVPSYYFNLAEKNIPDSFFDDNYKNVMDFFKHLSRNSYAYGINFFLKSVNNSIMSYYYGGECYLSVISNIDNSSTIINQISVKIYSVDYLISLNDLAVFLSSNNEIIIPLIPDEIISSSKNILNKDELSILKEKICYSGSDQNVILLKINIR